MKVSMVQESSRHASLQISDIEYHNFFKRNIGLITNCVLTFSKCVFSKYYASSSLAWYLAMIFVYSICFFLRMICSSFKSENLVIMQVLTTSRFWPEAYNLISVLYTVQRYYTSHFYSAFIFLLESKTSSMVEKSLNKSFQTSYTFLEGSKYQTSNDAVYPQFKSRNKHSSTLGLKDRKFLLGCI